MMITTVARPCPTDEASTTLSGAASTAPQWATTRYGPTASGPSATELRIDPEGPRWCDRPADHRW